MSLQMIPPNAKELIYQNLVKTKSFKELEALKLISKDWYYIILSLQWEKYTTHKGPEWYNFKDYVIPKEYEFAFYEYGRYNVKYIEFCFGYNYPPKQIYHTHCPNLKWLHLLGDDLDKDNVTRFIELNPSIVNFSIVCGGTSRISFDTDYLLGLNLQKLTKIKMYGITFKIFNLSFIFDRFPNLREMYVERLDLSDASDIIFPKDSSQLPNEFKQFSNIKSLELDQISIPNTKSLIGQQSDMILGIPNLFPNLATLKIDSRRINPYNPLIKSHLVLKNIGHPRFPLLQLSKLEAISINLEIANNLATNCPNIQELVLKTQKRSDNNSCYEVLRIFANSFPKLVRFNFKPFTFDGAEIEDGCNSLDALFFDQSVKLLKSLNKRNWVPKKERDDLSFEIPVKFNWPNLREIVIESGRCISPRSLSIFNQFQNLEKLHLCLERLATTHDVKQYTDIHEINESNAILNKSNCFPKLFNLNVRLCKKCRCNHDQCVEFINMFPVLMKCQIYWVKDKDVWNKIKGTFPNVAWDII